MIETRNLTKTYWGQARDGRKRSFDAVKDINIQIPKGQFCALVGESGSGKSTLSRLLSGLIPPTQGDVFLDGESITMKKKKGNKSLCKRLQLVLQDGKSVLDPRYTVYQCIAEPIRNLSDLSKEEERQRVAALMEQMELPQSLGTRKPHELSGGQQKRVCIARALACEPEVVIFDEAVSGLDVVVRKTILDLLKSLHRQKNATYLLITHDIDVALYMAKRIFVMKEGRIVEDVWYQGDIRAFRHPYSKMLLQAVMPSVSDEKKTKISVLDV